MICAIQYVKGVILSAVEVVYINTSITIIICITIIIKICSIQDLKRIIPDAVESAGDVKLPGAGQVIVIVIFIIVVIIAVIILIMVFIVTSTSQVEDMLIVNKDRLFLENVGAVRELSKVEVSISNMSIKISDHPNSFNRRFKFFFFLSNNRSCVIRLYETSTKLYSLVSCIHTRSETR